eukprot:239767-Amphidinium_carterae.1
MFTTWTFTLARHATVPLTMYRLAHCHLITAMPTFLGVGFCHANGTTTKFISVPQMLSVAV